eukprot:2564187-Pleurochrysis_carterae.AAC.1
MRLTNLRCAAATTRSSAASRSNEPKPLPSKRLSCQSGSAQEAFGQSCRALRRLSYKILLSTDDEPQPLPLIAVLDTIRIELAACSGQVKTNASKHEKRQAASAKSRKSPPCSVRAPPALLLQARSQRRFAQSDTNPPNPTHTHTHTRRRSFALSGVCAFSGAARLFQGREHAAEGLKKRQRRRNSAEENLLVICARRSNVVGVEWQRKVTSEQYPPGG